MYYSRNIFVFLENCPGIIIVFQINPIIFYFFTGYFFYSIKQVAGTAGIIINRNYIETIFNEISDGVRTYVSTSSGYKDFIHKNVLDNILLQIKIKGGFHHNKFTLYEYFYQKE